MRRKTILATGEIYHIYNRGVEKRPLFLNRRDYLRFLQTANYYRFADCRLKFSHLVQLSREARTEIISKLEKKSEKLVDVLCFCLMPNHIHFLLKQLQDNGISKFMAKITNGYSHYFNIKNKRVGHLFQGNFGAVRIETNEQLIHVFRYIHLNPVTSYLIKFDDLENYEWSSYAQCIGIKAGFCDAQPVMSNFKNIESYKKFVADQVDYAKELENIKHLTLEI